tara:strand:+ start:355 stop:564 length:210 start_codon:yes stop_codon:yes gene_type:complete
MTVYFLVDDNNLVANIAEYPNGIDVPNEVSSNWLTTEETNIGGKVYNSSDKTFSVPTGELEEVEPTSQI